MTREINKVRKNIAGNHWYHLHCLSLCEPSLETVYCCSQPLCCCSSINSHFPQKTSQLFHRRRNSVETKPPQQIFSCMSILTTGGATTICHTKMYKNQNFHKRWLVTTMHIGITASVPKGKQLCRLWTNLHWTYVRNICTSHGPCIQSFIAFSQ